MAFELNKRNTIIICAVLLAMLIPLVVSILSLDDPEKAKSNKAHEDYRRWYYEQREGTWVAEWGFIYCLWEVSIVAGVITLAVILPNIFRWDLHKVDTLKESEDDELYR